MKSVVRSENRGTNRRDGGKGKEIKRMRGRLEGVGWCWRGKAGKDGGERLGL